MAPITSKKFSSKYSAMPEVRTSCCAASVGMVVMDLSFKPVAIDKGAASILADSSRQLNGEAGIRIPPEVLEFVQNWRRGALSSGAAHFRIGQMDFICRAYLAEPQDGTFKQPVLVLHFERGGSASDAILKISEEFRLTDREQEALRGISLGLTSKELAERMNISPNTVRAFLRLIMIKMDATTRTGVVAKILDYTRSKDASC